MPALILQLTRIGFLVLLCLFVLAAIRVVRADLRYAGEPRSDGGRRRGQQHAVAPAPAARLQPLPSFTLSEARRGRMIDKDTYRVVQPLHKLSISHLAVGGVEPPEQP